MSAATGLVGSVVSAFGAIQQGDAARAAEEYNAQVQVNNAKVASDAAAQAALDQADRTHRLVATQRVAAAAAGVDPNSGSPLAVMSDTAARGTLDALRIRYQGQLQSNADLSQATLDRYQGVQAQNAGYFKAASTVLTGASSYASAVGTSGVA